MATINGSIAYDPRIQGTSELTYLLKSMGGIDPLTGLESTFAFKKDYANSPNGDWIAGYTPYTSDVGIGKVGLVLTRNINTYTRSLTAGHIAQSYLFDFYYRIHSSLVSIKLGNVLSEQIFTIEIWNSYFVTSTISAINNTLLPDALLNFPPGLPYTFKPLEFVDATLTVEAVGQSVINGFYTLVFGTQTITIYVTGQRVILWPFAPQTLTGKREWLTDIIPSRHGEQRFTLRETPREILSYNYLFKDTREYSLAKVIGQFNSHLALATPLWTDAVQLTNLVIGQTSVFFTTANLELQVNSIVVFWSNFDSYELSEVLSVFSDHIVLKQTIKIDRKKCWIIPVFIGYTESGINLNRSENKSLTGAVDFNITNTYNLPVWPNGITYLGLPVVIDNSIVTGGLSERFSRDTSTFDSETGELVNYNNDDYNRGNQILSLKAKSRVELYSIRRMFDYLQGKFNTFWLPAFNSDLVAVESLALSATSIKVVYGGWAQFGVNYIRILGTTGTILYFQVTSSTDNLDGSETLALTPSASSAIPIIKRIEILTKMRLDTDSIEFSRNNTRVTTVKAACIEVLN